MKYLRALIVATFLPISAVFAQPTTGPGQPLNCANVQAIPALEECKKQGGVPELADCVHRNLCFLEKQISTITIPPPPNLTLSGDVTLSQQNVPGLPPTWSGAVVQTFFRPSRVVHNIGAGCGPQVIIKDDGFVLGSLCGGTVHFTAYR